MDKITNTKQEIKFVYEKSPNYFETFASSVFGGIAPNGMLEIYLIEESNNLPNSETVIVSPDNPFTPSGQFDLPTGAKKIVKGRIVLPIDSIPSIAEWLKIQYDQFQKAKEQLKGGGK